MNTYNLLAKLPYNAGEDNKYDEYLQKHLSSDRLSDLLCNFGKHNSFKLINNTIDLLNKQALDDEAYTEDVCNTLEYYSDVQKRVFWDKFNKKIQFVNNEEYVIVRDFIRALANRNVEKEKLYLCFKSLVLPNLSSRYSYQNYLNLAVEFMSVVKDIADISVINEYASILIKAITIHTNIVITAYKQINSFVEENTWLVHINTLLQNVNENNYDDMYLIVNERQGLFTEKNENLSNLVGFYIDGFEFSKNPENIVKKIGNKFKSIGRFKDLVIKIINNTVIDQEHVVSKLIDNEIDGSKQVYEILENIEEKDHDYLRELLSYSQKYNSTTFMKTVLSEKEHLSKKELISLLEYIQQDISKQNLSSFIDILEYISENTTELDLNNKILERIRWISNGLLTKDSRKLITEIIYNIFRNTTSIDLKKACIDQITVKKLTRYVKEVMDENVFKEYSELIG